MKVERIIDGRGSCGGIIVGGGLVEGRITERIVGGKW